MGIAPYHDVGRSLVLGETATGIGCWRRATVCHKLVTGWGKGCLRGENQTIGFHPRVLGMFPTPSQKIPKRIQRELGGFWGRGPFFAPMSGEIHFRNEDILVWGP